jgi:hypothetical protein
MLGNNVPTQFTKVSVRRVFFKKKILLVVCIFDFFWHYVDAEAACNWYMFDINILPLLKKSKWYMSFTNSWLLHSPQGEFPSDS